MYLTNWTGLQTSDFYLFSQNNKGISLGRLLDETTRDENKNRWQPVGKNDTLWPDWWASHVRKWGEVYCPPAWVYEWQEEHAGRLRWLCQSQTEAVHPDLWSWPHRAAQRTSLLVSNLSHSLALEYGVCLGYVQKNLSHAQTLAYSSSELHYLQ